MPSILKDKLVVNLNGRPGPGGSLQDLEITEDVDKIAEMIIAHNSKDMIKLFLNDISDYESRLKSLKKLLTNEVKPKKKVVMPKSGLKYKTRNCKFPHMHTNLQYRRIDRPSGGAPGFYSPGYNRYPRIEAGPALDRAINNYHDDELRPKDWSVFMNKCIVNIKYYSQGSTNCEAMKEMLTDAIYHDIIALKYDKRCKVPVHIEVGSRDTGILKKYDFKI